MLRPVWSVVAFCKLGLCIPLHESFHPHRFEHPFYLFSASITLLLQYRELHPSHTSHVCFAPTIVPRVKSSNFEVRNLGRSPFVRRLHQQHRCVWVHIRSMRSLFPSIVCSRQNVFFFCDPVVIEHGCFASPCAKVAAAGTMWYARNTQNHHRSLVRLFHTRQRCSFTCVQSHNLTIRLYKAGYTLIISRISTCSYTILWDCQPITTHFSQYTWFRSSLILRETWQETCHIILFDISWKYRLPGENGETRDEKNDWRDCLRNAIYTLLVSLISPTFFCVLVNLTINV